MQCLASRTTDHGVPGSRPSRAVVRCGLVQVTFTPYLVLVKPVRLTLADCDAAGDYVVPNVLSPRDIVSRRNGLIFHTENFDMSEAKHATGFKSGEYVERKTDSCLPIWCDTSRTHPRTKVILDLHLTYSKTWEYRVGNKTMRMVISP